MDNRGSKSKIRFPILIPLMMKRDPTRQATGWPPLPTPLGPSKGAFDTTVAVAVSAPAMAVLVKQILC
jgi:hypothetical protein